MAFDLSGAILRICQVLNEHSVQYIVVGGVAVTLHGYFRESIDSAGKPTKLDIDVWYNPTYNNYFKLLNVLEELGQDVNRFRSETVPDPKRSFFRYEFHDFTLDFLPAIKAQLSFRSCFLKRETLVLNGIEIPFIGYEDLIEDKTVNARSKDLEDIEQLKKRNDND